MATRIVQGGAPDLIVVEAGRDTIALGLHPGDLSRVDVIVDDQVWVEVSWEDWERVVAHLAAQRPVETYHPASS